MKNENSKFDIPWEIVFGVTIGGIIGQGLGILIAKLIGLLP